MHVTDLVAKLRHWMRPWVAGSEPMEIHRAVLEEVESKVVAVGGGRRVFPYNRVIVHLLAESAEERVRLETVAREGWDLPREIPERLRERDARVPADLAVEVRVAEEPFPESGERRFFVECRQEGEGGTSAPRPSRRPTLDLTVVKGKATRQVYNLEGERVYVGRLEEVLDASGRVKRRNDVAFLEDGEANRTVSREHARIAWDEASGSFWVRDEGSASGTRVFRSGRSIEVSQHDRQGIRLQTGDEIYFGRAAVKVGIRAGE